MMNENDEGKCNIYAYVNFGRGPVEIRCTKIGEHQIHRCEVTISDNEVKISDNLSDLSIWHQNIFEKGIKE